MTQHKSLPSKNSSAPASNDADSTLTDSSKSSLGRLAYLSDKLDTQFSVPGIPFRFGLDGILGLVPGVGDIVTGGMGLYALKVAYDHEQPLHVHGRILGNLLIDSVIGSIPLLGDIFDFAFHSHRKNYKLLKRRLENVQS